jgi:hypothetical protein
MKKKEFKIEYLVYLYVIICPFLDALSCMFRIWFPNALLSPLMIIRPIIPGILLLYIFARDKSVRKPLILSGIGYLLYGIVHLLIFKKLSTGISYGSLFQEGLYIFNYTYMICILFIIMYFSKRELLPHLKKALFIMLCSYLLLIYVSILTKTSLPTYIEGTGYRSWFVSGNSLCTALLLLFSVFTSEMFKKKNLKYLFIFVLLGVYLMFLVGTRTGLYGFVLVFGFYIFLKLYIAIKHRVQFNRNRVAIMLVIIAIFGLLAFKIGSSTLERRREIKNMTDDIVDINNNYEIAHVTGDTTRFVYDIKHDQVAEGLMSEEQKRAYLDMYDACNKLKIESNSYRKQQLIYNFYLVREQHNILYALFGNGHVNLYGEMILEMELPYILLNFGIIGFIIYALPLLYLTYKGIKYAIGHKKFLFENYYMELFGLILALGLASVAGYVLFSSTCALIIICILGMLEEQGDIL